MKFEIKNQLSNAVQFTADIECDIDASYPIKAGLAVKWSIINHASLNNAQLNRANLRHAWLQCANLSCANLSGANLSGANLTGANLSGADFRGADISETDLSGANLSCTNLHRADFSNANLHRANLSCANLSLANLTGTNLSGANLHRASGITKLLSTPLIMLFDQPGKIRAYKLVTAAGTGPHYPSISYSIGAEISVDNASTDPSDDCGEGINVATLDWCLREWRYGYRILIVEFVAADIACVPNGSDGKFRLHRCKVIEEKQINYKVLDLAKADV